MISDKYIFLLEQEARNLDCESGNDKRFESIVNSITKEQNTAASLELIKELTQIGHNSVFSGTKKHQKRILNLL